MESCNFCSSKHHRTNWLCLLFCCPFSKMQEHSCLNLRKKQKTFFNYSKWQKEFRKHEQLEFILNLRAHSSVTSFVFGFVAETDFVGPNVHSWLSLFIWTGCFFSMWHISTQHKTSNNLQFYDERASFMSSKLSSEATKFYQKPLQRENWGKNDLQRYFVKLSDTKGQTF